MVRRDPPLSLSAGGGLGAARVAPPPRAKGPPPVWGGVGCGGVRRGGGRQSSALRSFCGGARLGWPVQAVGALPGALLLFVCRGGSDIRFFVCRARAQCSLPSWRGSRALSVCSGVAWLVA